jgi:hypothetical protein
MPFLPVVRSIPVLPRFRSLPLTYPLRLLQVEASSAFRLRRTIVQIFGGAEEQPRDLQEIARSVRVRRALRDATVVDETTFEGLSRFLGQRGWPTIDVLHLSRRPNPEGDILSPASPTDPETLGGLIRLCDSQQTRLVVIECRTELDTDRALPLAHALASRGGPAILLCAWDAETLGRFYDRLVHDNPLDWILGDVWGSGPRGVLFAGAGREDALRVSTPAVVLSQVSLRVPAMAGVEIDSGPVDAGIAPSAPMEDAFREVYRRGGNSRRGVPEADVLERLDVEVGKLQSGFAKQYWFSDHESEGFLPISSRIRDLRRILGVEQSVSLQEALSAPEGPRHLNVSLLTGEGESPRPVDAAEERLQLGAMYHLSVQIGPQDLTLRVVGAAAIVEEVFKWTPEMEGTWVEIAVTGLDFDVLGDPLREVWLPRRGPTDPVTWPVVPQRAVTSCLRVCLYHRNNVVQSIKLAALVAEGDERGPLGGADAMELADALGVSPESTYGVTYLRRLEYNQAALDDAESCPPRTLSMLANDARGADVLAVKTDGGFEARIHPDLGDYVKGARDEMVKASIQPGAPPEPTKWLYRFAAASGEQNTGTAELHLDAMRRMARAGSNLWGEIFRRETRTALQAVLGAGECTIHIANMLVEKTIPWATIYDGEVAKPDANEAGVAYAACSAPVSGADGQLRDIACGTDETCPLNPKHLADCRAKGEPVPQVDSVICPLRFWGFRHVIEVPPLQVSEKKTPPTMVREIAASNPPRLVMGYHSGLATAPDHVKAMCLLMKGPPVRGDIGTAYAARRALLDALGQTDADLVYLFCHTRGGVYAVEKVHPPELDLADGEIVALDLGNRGPWSHHPLVILNGCNTAGFSSDALSPFITALVEDCGAAGVLGTEVPVPEELAAEVAKIFMTEFLDGHSAAEALLAARRRLLAKRNPLGLVYTLYAAADLGLRRRVQQPERPHVRIRKSS